jgi:hypothetical protein
MGSAQGGERQRVVTTVLHRASGWRFTIAPVLSWGSRYDPYERYLVARIRSGTRTNELFDSNSLFVGSVGEHDLQRVGIKPPRPTKEQMEAYRLAMAEESAKRDERIRRINEARQAREAELERERKSHERRRAKMEAARQRQAAEWDAEVRRRDVELPWSARLATPPLGRRREVGDNNIAIVVSHLGTSDTEVLVEAGCGWARIAKNQIREVNKIWTGASYVTELTITREAAAGLRQSPN